MWGHQLCTVTFQLYSCIEPKLPGRAGDKALGSQRGPSLQDWSDADSLIAFHDTDVCDYSRPLDSECERKSPWSGVDISTHKSKHCCYVISFVWSVSVTEKLLGIKGLALSTFVGSALRHGRRKMHRTYLMRQGPKYKETPLVVTATPPLGHQGTAWHLELWVSISGWIQWVPKTGWYQDASLCLAFF